MDIESYKNHVLSYGGGVNSTALAILLINNGWRGDIVFADTGTEWPDTYCFMDYFESEWLKLRRLSLTRLAGLPWQTKKGGISLIEYCESASVIPLAAVRWCTSEWKVEPISMWADGKSQLIGIDAGERHRLSKATRPLVDWGIDRKGCVNIIQEEGLNVPRKSGCWICPFQRNSQWRELWERYPDLFNRAMLLEESVERSRDGRFRATLDPQGKTTLRQCQFGYNNQLVLPEVDMDGLRAYQPCICGL